MHSLTAPFVPSTRGLHPSVHRRSTYGQPHAEPGSLRLLPNKPRFASETPLGLGVTVHMDGTLRDMGGGRVTHSPVNRILLGFDPIDRALPFVEQAQALGLSLQLSRGLSTSFFTNPQASYASNPSGDYTKAGQSGLAGISLAGTLPMPESFGHADWLLGAQQEQGSFRNGRGYGALQLGPQTKSIFFSPRFWLQTSQNTTLELGASLGVSRTDMAPAHGSMIDSMSANMQDAVYNPILDALSDHKVVSLGALEKTLASSNIRFAQILQACMVLVGKGDLCPAQDDAVIQKSKKATERANQFLMNKARGTGDISYLASPVTGGGVMASRFQQLFLLSRQSGKKTPEEWANDAWGILKAQGQRIIKDGKPIELEDENLKELNQQAKEFASGRLTVLKALQVG